MAVAQQLMQLCLRFPRSSALLRYTQGQPSLVPKSPAACGKEGDWVVMAAPHLQLLTAACARPRCDEREDSPGWACASKGPVENWQGAAYLYYTQGCLISSPD